MSRHPDGWYPNKVNVIIELPNGGTMEVECTPLLLEQVRIRYDLQTVQEVTADHIKRFITIELISAINKESPND